MSNEPFRLMVVDYVFQNRDCVSVFPGLPARELPRAVGVGDKVELRRPDGKQIATTIAGIEHAKKFDGSSAYPLRFPLSVCKEDVPLGTEVWWMAPKPTLGGILDA